MADDSDMPPFPPNDPLDGLIAHWRHQQNLAVRVAADAVNMTGLPPLVLVEATKPDILLQAVVTFRDKSQEGQLIEAVAVPWFEIIRHMARDPAFMFTIDPWKLEEIIAGAWEREGYKVILTPRSGDRGRDVIATREGVGSVRLFDQVKRYHRGNRVTLDQVSSMLGVLTRDLNVSKGIVTTTGDFAPGVYDDPALKAFMPYRLDLRNGQQLSDWLLDVSKRRPLSG